MLQRLFLLPLFALVVMFAVPVGGAMGADYQTGLDAYKKRDYATALRDWEPLAQQGNARVQYNLGNMFHFGQGIPQNHKTAVNTNGH